MIRTCVKAMIFSFLFTAAFGVASSYANPVLNIMVPKGEKVAGDPHSATGATLSFGIVRLVGEFIFERKNNREIRVKTNSSLVITFRCDCSNRIGDCNLIVSGGTMACRAGGCNKKCDLKLLVNMPVELKITNPKR